MMSVSWLRVCAQSFPVAADEHLDDRDHVIKSLPLEGI
jgi:hypothetical protein